MSKRILLAFLVLALASMACGVNVNVPTKTPGPDVTDEISVPAPDAETANLTLSFGAGDLTIKPGDTDLLVEGTVTYNIPDFAVDVVTSDANVEIKQGSYELNGFPNMEGIHNTWDLALGSAPLALTIKAGAYDGNFDLGGLSLTNLTINDGAADVDVDFSSLNLVKMGVLQYQTGASNVNLYNLANANFSSLVFEGGAGNYKLEFGGELQRDASANIRVGMSNLTLVIPDGMSVQLKVDSGLSNVQTPSGWEKQGDNTYVQAADGPQLVIFVELGAGNLQVVR